jgi:N-acetylglucosaminyldiphosphoundecaprenol N-acetyl-beta-D-mannosaminyltransferase
MEQPHAAAPDANLVVSAKSDSAGKRTPGLPAGLVSRRILGMRVDASDYAHTTEAICELARAGQGGRVCVATVHMVMEAWDDPGYQRLVNGAELVTSDGVPLVWGLRALGADGATRVYGPELMPRLCERAAEQGIPVGFYGGSREVQDALVAELIARSPGLYVRFSHSPPFAPLPATPDPDLVETLRASGTALLFVGLGCPKQERFMALYRDALPCVQVGVGAAFDFLAGRKAQAPRFLQDAGLEWLFRLACEPRRLARRYLVHNPRFLALFARQLWRERAA